MRYSLLAHRLLFPGLAALSVALVYSLASPGGGNAQTPVPSATSSPTASPTFFIPAATLTAAAGNPQVAAQQQVPATATATTTVPNVAATATYIAAIQQQQGAMATATYVASLTQPNVAATATYIASITQAQTALTPSPTPSTAVAAAATATPVAAPPAATAVDACAMPLAAASGGQTIQFQQVALTLPASGNYVYGLIDASGNAAPQIVVCSVPTTSTIYINAMTGAETARRSSGEAGTNALNAIRAGARAQGSTPVAISPPNTGDAGLR